MIQRYNDRKHWEGGNKIKFFVEFVLQREHTEWLLNEYKPISEN